MKTLCECAYQVLTTADPHKKAKLSHDYVISWRENKHMSIGTCELPDKPARPQKPELRNPSEMPKRSKAGSTKGKIALLHALAHIELNAIDLAWDLMARFSYLSQKSANDEYHLPRKFYDDWCGVAADEAKHFLMLSERLQELGAAYGDLPAHEGLWEAAQKTAHDFSARLAIVPMVLEARGLDVTPNMIKAMKAQGDDITAEILQIIHDEEITHVRAGTDWFEHWCTYQKLDIESAWQKLVRTYFNGKLKKPFNDDSREKAGMIRDWYEKLADNP